MKKINYILSTATLLLVACQREIAPQEPAVAVPGPTSFTASVEVDPDSKAVLGLNGESKKPQTFWEDGDAISIFTSADGNSQSGKSYKFTTTLQASSTSADFSLAEEKEFGSGMYFAAYPYRNNTRGVNYTGNSGYYRMAGNQIPTTQTLVAGSFDRNAILAVAFAESGNTLEFKNATALLKFRVAETNIVAGRIQVDKADAISGTFRADVKTDTKALSLETYSGGTTFNFVDFTIDGSTALSTGTDYYVVVRPTTLTSDLKIYLNGNLVKTINTSQLASIERNKIYNLGTLTTPGVAVEKVLTFDFTRTPLEGWPTKGNYTYVAGGTQCTYPLYGQNYTFVLADSGGCSKANTFWATTNPGNRIALAAQYRYFGFPAIPGYKLVEVSCLNIRCSSNDTTTDPKIAVTDRIATSTAAAGALTDESDDIVDGGEFQTWVNAGGQRYTYTLSGTTANTVYYFYAKAKGAIANLTLTYIPI